MIVVSLHKQEQSTTVDQHYSNELRKFRFSGKGTDSFTKASVSFICIAYKCYCGQYFTQKTEKVQSSHSKSLAIKLHQHMMAVVCLQL